MVFIASPVLFLTDVHLLLCITQANKDEPNNKDVAQKDERLSEIRKQKYTF